MFKELFNRLPGYKFWLANTLFWLVLNTISAAHTHRWEVQNKEHARMFYEVWLYYLPWWGNWIFIAPVIIAATSMISLDKNSPLRFTLKSLFVASVIFVVYWGVTMLEVILLKGKSINAETISTAFDSLLRSPLYMDVLVYIAVFGTGYAMSYHQKVKLQQQINEQLSKQLLEVELHSLKSQLNPHFLFNTLNTISSLVRLDERNTAIKAISELSKMLRKVLENRNNQVISLKDEMEFIESYLAIQQLRFEDKLKISVNVSKGCMQNEIPFMLLQTLVENAVQHGSQLETNENHITLDINCNDGQLYIRLVNIAPETDEHKGFGIGLKNCQQRMEKLYQDKFSLELKELQDGYFETSLTLPLREYHA
ncbi:sensor histidine kinase [Thalassotalea ganghwensis]